MTKSSVLDPQTNPKEIVLDQKSPLEVRTRFAPSPTGLFHVGGARTALFNYLFAKANNGAFVLRIEDTDKERSKPEYEKNILESLKWLGMEWDEGPDIGGPFGPYRQSEKTDVYAKYLQKLLDEGLAYYCFCSEEDLDAERQYRESQGQAPIYSGKCSNLTKEEVAEKIANGESSVIRFKINPEKVKFDDLVRGRVEFDAALFGDVVIAKNLNEPLYNFSVVIDDYEMKITHVIRGEEHLSNTPRQILILKALGLPQPKYAHIPIILAPDRTKLSKRHGATSTMEYSEQGYLPEAMVNFLALLGWNPGTDKEIFSLRTLAKEFSIDRVQKSGAIFNIKRLDWINGFYIRNTSLERLTQLCVPYFISSGFIQIHDGEEKFHLGEENYKILETREIISFSILQKYILLYQERLKKLSEISGLCEFFFKDKLEYQKELLWWPRFKGEEIGEDTKKENDKNTKDVFEDLEKLLSEIKDEDWTKENLENILMKKAEETGDRGKILWPLRASLTGTETSAGPIDIVAILGKEKTLTRIKNALNKL